MNCQPEARPGMSPSDASGSASRGSTESAWQQNTKHGFSTVLKWKPFSNRARSNSARCGADLQVLLSRLTRAALDTECPCWLSDARANALTYRAGVGEEEGWLEGLLGCLLCLGGSKRPCNTCNALPCISITLPQSFSLIHPHMRHRQPHTVQQAPPATSRRGPPCAIC